MAANSAAIPQRLAAIAASTARDAEANAAGFRWDPATGLAATARPPPPRDRRELHVLVTRVGKQVFSTLRDDRVRVFWPGRPVTNAPDLVVVNDLALVLDGPSEQHRDDGVLERLRSGAAKLLIDVCGEGTPYQTTLFARLHEALDRWGVRASHCIYLTQDRGFRAAYLADRQARNLDGPPIEVLVHDRYIQYICTWLGEDGEIFGQRLAAYAERLAARSRRFICLNNKFRPVRTLFLLRMMRDGLWSHGHISLGKLDEIDGAPVHRKKLIRRMMAFEGLGPLAQELAPMFDQLHDRARSFIGIERRADDGAPKLGGERDMILPSLFGEYGDSWFSIVTETDFSNRLHRITEKAFKPLLCFHPMIVLGSLGSLRLIRNYGFRTFPGLFDESYDQEHDPRARFEMVFDQAARASRMGEAQLARLCEEQTETVVYNACWGLTRLPGLFRDRIEGALVDRLIAVVHGDTEQSQPA